ncbi:unnamed protein product [Blumeria hordei]|uniref:Uncharacterized protein n=1 Tax=Blumeria hordei TaxID=2867405 RepID=A0A383V336_BLUHO|nr:unnamed protein product [Blumeria hordei]
MDIYYTRSHVMRKETIKDHLSWEAFGEEFKGFTAETFNIADSKIRRDFRNFPVQHMAYNPINGGKVSDALLKVICD